jgi:hypothetical protein
MATWAIHEPDVAVDRVTVTVVCPLAVFRMYPWSMKSPDASLALQFEQCTKVPRPALALEICVLFGSPVAVVTASCPAVVLVSVTAQVVPVAQETFDGC